MESWVWTAIGLALACMVVGVVVVLRRRRSRATDDKEAAMRAARRAIRQSAWDQRQRGRGTIRGKGQGGDQGLAIDSALGSEGGGTP